MENVFDFCEILPVIVRLLGERITSDGTSSGGENGDLLVSKSCATLKVSDSPTVQLDSGYM